MKKKVSQPVDINANERTVGVVERALTDTHFFSFQIIRTLNILASELCVSYEWALWFFFECMESLIQIQTGWVGWPMTHSMAERESSLCLKTLELWRGLSAEIGGKNVLHMTWIIFFFCKAQRTNKKRAEKFQSFTTPYWFPVHKSVVVVVRIEELHRNRQRLGVRWRLVIFPHRRPRDLMRTFADFSIQLKDKKSRAALLVDKSMNFLLCFLSLIFYSALNSGESKAKRWLHSSARGLITVSSEPRRERRNKLCFFAHHLASLCVSWFRLRLSLSLRTMKMKKRRRHNHNCL